MEVAQVQREMQNVAVRLNVVDLIFHVVREVSGNDISTTINDSKVTKEMIKSLIDNKLRSHNNITDGTYDVSHYYSAKGGSLLESLVNASIPLVSDVPNPSNDYSGFYEIIKTNIEAMGKVNGQHSVLMNDCVKLLSTAVTNHIKIAKTVVLPKIKAILDEYDIMNAQSSSMTPRDPLGNSEIVIYDRPELISNSEIVDVIEKYKGSDLVEPLSSLNLEVPSTEAIILGCTTGDKNLDEDIIAYLHSVPEMDVVEAYIRFFGNCKSHFSPDNLLKANGYDRLVAGVVGYMTAIRLLDNIPDGITMSSKDYINFLSEVINFSGTLISTAVDMIEGYDRTETLLLSRGDDPYKPVVCVNGNIYREWIKDNSEELVIASSVASRPRYTVPAIASHKEEIMNEWVSYCALAKINNTREAVKNTKSMLYAYGYSSELTELENSYLTRDSEYMVKVKKNVDNYVSNLSGIDLEDMDNVCLHLIAKCRFYFTSAYVILSAMNEAYRINNDLEPREAALLSVIDYLVEYMSSQINVEVVTDVPYAINRDQTNDINTNPVKVKDNKVDDTKLEAGVAVSEGA